MLLKSVILIGSQWISCYSFGTSFVGFASEPSQIGKDYFNDVSKNANRRHRTKED
jgi:hypothetical protein